MDLGAGVGTAAIAAALAGYEALAVDVNAQSRAVALRAAAANGVELFGAREKPGDGDPGFF